MKKSIKKYLNIIFSTRAAGIYMILFAFVIGLATFIENDYGTSAAQKVVFKSKWFELLLFLFCLTLIWNIVKYKMVQQKRWAVLTFHLAIIVILIGAGITRYFGYEGMMHIRENGSSNTFLSADTYLQFDIVKNGQRVQLAEPVLFASLGNNNWHQSYLLGEDLIDVSVKQFIPNPIQVLKESDAGKPIIQVILSGESGREEYFIAEGQSTTIRNIRFNFTDTYDPQAINLSYDNESLLIQSNKILTQMTMATQQIDTIYPDEGPQELILRSLYSDGMSNMVFGSFNPDGAIEVISETRKVKNESLMALLMDISVNGVSKETFVVGKKGVQSKPIPLDFEELSVGVSYGSKTIVLPFSLNLYDFVMERYPGTNSAASYASEVQLVDKRKNIEKDYRIYMNNILTYGGYRFFQSSFDKDERGTYLSVNHDFWGTWVSYLGYFLLTLGLVMTFFTKGSRFHQLTQKIQNIRADRAFMILGFCLLSATTVISQEQISPIKGFPILDIEHATQFSKIVVQDHRGRMKPMHTLSRELMRKLSRTEEIFDLTADQVVLSMYADRNKWRTVPMIKMGKHPILQKQLGVKDDYIAYEDFFDGDGNYFLENDVKNTYDLQPIDRGTYEKELIKIDERVNIASMIYSGRFFKIIPVPNDPNNTWLATAPMDMGGIGINNFNPAASRFFTSYQPTIHDALHTGDYDAANTLLDELVQYQQINGGEVMPSEVRIKSEIFLNNLKVFNRLSGFYTLLGILFLILLFTSIFKPEINLIKVFKVLFWLIIIGFFFHTLGLGLRWYVSGRAPWSNGYESMIYIAWTATLAGMLFTRKSIGGLAATMVLAGTILLVAQLSYLDPEITPLVPVLRSYWLTIHVSLIAGSYGFLMLGALIGIINLILMIFLSVKNEERIARIIKEMSYISELTLIGGLIMVSVGTYLGGIWANESWGRYWGWDAKETWALVTILVYAFILHMRLIPKMKGLYAYNLATLFGWASVLMTYFGVNYYLSGLHSYAAGDPIPVPNWVYISVIVAIVIGILAYLKKRKYTLIS